MSTDVNAISTASPVTAALAAAQDCLPVVTNGKGMTEVLCPSAVKPEVWPEVPGVAEMRAEINRLAAQAA